MDDVRAMAQQLQAAASRIQQLEVAVRTRDARLRDLEALLQQRDARLRELASRAEGAAPVPSRAATPHPFTPALDTGPATSETELGETLKRLVTKIAMILQAEKCFFLLHDQHAGDLYAHRPAFGIPDDQVRLLRTADDQGVSGAVFQCGRPLIVDDLRSDPRAEPWLRDVVGARNGASVPLFIEKRDDEGRVIDRVRIGVLHVFNKRYGARFSNEDIHLLGVLSRNAAAVIANAKLFFEVARERDQMEATLESLTAGLVMVGTNGKIMLMNPSAEAMLGVPGDEETGRPFDEVITRGRVSEMLHLAVSAGQEVAGEEITLTHRDPETGEEHESIYQAQTVLVRNTETRDTIGAALILNDITEIRSIERLKSAFVSTISHELNTPLTAIKGFIATLLQDRDGSYDLKTRREFHQIIDSECDRLGRLIGNLLNLSHIESGRTLELDLQSVNIPAVVNHVVDAHRPYLTERHEIVTEVAPALPDIIADQAQVEQILSNITSNAIKFSPDGGKITIRVGPDHDGIRFDVSDDGVGIPDEHLPHIFDRFHRVDNRDTRETYGAGIGLYLTRHLVEAHGGSVSVESEVGKGTTFTFRLPLKPPEAES